MSHIKTAHDLGVQKALKEAGYSSIEEVQKLAQQYGLIEQPTKQASEVDLRELMGRLASK